MEPITTLKTFFKKQKLIQITKEKIKFEIGKYNNIIQNINKNSMLMIVK